MTNLALVKQGLAGSQKALQNFLGDEKNALRFMSAAVSCVQHTPELQNCTQESLMGAFMECASIGLFPSNWQGDCYILPYKSQNGTQAQFQMGYKGFKTLAYRNGVSLLNAEIVYEHDEFGYALGINPRLDHRPAKGDRGKPIAAYAYAKINGETIFNVMYEADIMKIKATSKAKNSKFSPWNSNDPEKWMWRKTVIKQLAKLLPTTEKIDRAIYLDNVSERGGYIKDHENIIEVPFETDDDKIDAVKAKREEMRKKQGKNEEKTTEKPEKNEVKNEDNE